MPKLESQQRVLRVAETLPLHRGHGFKDTLIIPPGLSSSSKEDSCCWSGARIGINGRSKSETKSQGRT